MKRQDVFPSNYLGKDDVLSPFTAKVGRVVMEELKTEGGKEQKAVLHFANDTQKPMILNNVNWTTLEEAYGDDSDYWGGKPVEVYVDPSVMFGGKRVGGVRLRVPGTNGAASHAAPPDVITWDYAQQIATNVGITKDEIIQKLKSLGRAGWNPERDTATVRVMIAEKQARDNNGREALPARVQGGEEIPFT